MKKRLLLGIFLGIMLIGFVSAQYGYYGSFSISNFLDSIGPSTMILLVLFIIFFALLHNIVFINFFRGNRTVSAIISFCVSLLAVYGINRARWDLGGLFYGLGISESALFTLIAIVLLIIVIYAIFTKKLKYLFLIFGIFLTLISLFTDLIYERGIAIVIGLVLLVIGGLLLKRKGRRAPYDHGGYPPSGSVGRGYKKFKDWRDPGRRLEKYGAKTGRLQQKEAAQLAKQAYHAEKWESRGKRFKRRAPIKKTLEEYKDIPRLKKIYKEGAPTRKQIRLAEARREHEEKWGKGDEPSKRRRDIGR